jgi:hypothetical protein
VRLAPALIVSDAQIAEADRILRDCNRGIPGRRLTLLAFPYHPARASTRAAVRSQSSRSDTSLEFTCM